MIDHPAQDLDQAPLEQPVGQQPRTAALAVGLGEQQMQGVVQFADRASGTTITGGSDCTIGLRAPPSKSSVAQVKSGPSSGAANTWCSGCGYSSRLGCRSSTVAARYRHRMADLHLTLAQDVQERTTLRLEHMAPAQRAAVEQRGLHPEAFQQGGEAVGRGAPRACPGGNICG
jgi:hypothetical protein